MKESDVLTRIGLKDKDELVYLLENSGLNERLSRLASIEREPHSISLEFCESGCYFKIVKDDVSDISSVKGEKFKFFRRGWSCVLKSQKNKNVSKLSSPNILEGQYNPKKLDGQYFFHSGHILGKQFYSFISDYSCNDKYSSAKDIINSKEKNIFLQFSVANKESSSFVNRRSQAYYENLVTDYFNADIEEIFYEIKAVFYSKDSKYPIGTEIFLKPIIRKRIPSLENDLEEIHVFIPNFDVDFNLSKLPSDYEGYVSYRKFYLEGYKEVYKDCFENIFKDNSDIVKNDEGERIFYLVLGQEKNAIFSHIGRAQKFLGVDTNALDIEQLPGDISKDEIFMFSENQQQVIFDYLKNQKLINSSRNKNYFYPVVRCSEYKGIYFSDQEIREKRIQFEKGAKTLEDALKLI
jgi:hypothetical protein